MLGLRLVKEISLILGYPGQASSVINGKGRYERAGFFMMKWLALGMKMLAHPSLLPIALATFVSVAGPGGIAEFGGNMPTGQIVAVAPQSPPVLSSEDPVALLVRVVHEQPPAPVGRVVEAKTPPSAEPDDAIGTSGDVSGAGEAPPATAADQDITPAVEPNQPPIEGGGAPADSNAPQQPADDPAEPAIEPEEPPDDVIHPDTPPEEGGDVDEQPPVEGGGDDLSDDT